MWEAPNALPSRPSVAAGTASGAPKGRQGIAQVFSPGFRRHFLWNLPAPSLKRIGAKRQIRRVNLGNTLHVRSSNRELHRQVATVGQIGQRNP